ncbi:MAG: class I SAM-dependent methyltransferase [Nitrospirota bacterium]
MKKTVDSDRPSWKDLRKYYDPALHDTDQRSKRAKRHRKALIDAGVWNSPPMRILDVGCGSGYLLDEFGIDASQRVGCDIRRDIYLQANIKKKNNILFIQTDAAKLPFHRDYFDLVICLAVIEEFPDWQKALEEMACCVSPGGLLYLTVTNGITLLPIYTLLSKIGLHISPASLEYAKASISIMQEDPGDGFGLSSLKGWTFFNITPYLAYNQFSIFRLIPIGLLNRLMSCLSPSLGYAWRRPES